MRTWMITHTEPKDSIFYNIDLYIQTHKIVWTIFSKEFVIVYTIHCTALDRYGGNCDSRQIFVSIFFYSKNWCSNLYVIEYESGDNFVMASVLKYIASMQLYKVKFLKFFILIELSLTLRLYLFYLVVYRLVYSQIAF